MLPSRADRLDALAAELRAVLGPLSRQLRQQPSDPLTATQVSVLASIHAHGPISLGDVAALERLSPPMITKVVRALDGVGFVERVRDPADRRICLVRVSARGNEWIEHGRARRDAWLAERLAALPPADAAALATAAPILGRLTSDLP